MGILSRFSQSISPAPDISGVLYRGGPDSNMPSGMTLADVIRYEQEELGNEFDVVYSFPSDYPASKLVWLCRTPEQAAHYGQSEEDVHEVDVPEGSKIVAEFTDEIDGGILVALP